MKINKMLLYFLIAIIATLFYTEVASANIAAIAVAPVTTSLALSEGETGSGAYIVYNNSDETQSVTVVPRYWQMADENKEISIDSWLKIKPVEFELAPREKKKILYTVTAPKEAIGELAAMISFKPKPKEMQPVNVVFSVSLYMRIKESEIISSEVGALKIYKMKDRKALGVNLVLKNTGNVHLKPKTTVYIQDLFNKTLQKTRLKYGKPAYPGRQQDYRGVIYDFELKPGLYKAFIETDYVNVPYKSRKKIWFIAGRGGKILFTLFKDK